MIHLWLWPILLLLAGLFLIALEVFIPSGGLLSVMAGIALVAGIIIAFMSSMLVGIVMVTVTLIALPVAIALAVRYWPQTPMGRLILVPRPKSADEVLPEGETRQLKALIGKVGRARSQMLPSGAVKIEGRTYDAVSAGMAIEPDQPVIVVAVRTNRLVVRPANPEQIKQAESGDEVLSQPLDNLGLDHPFDEPFT